MATRYVWSGATGGNTGADWTNAYTSMASAVSNAVGGDIVLVAHDHSESLSSAMSFAVNLSAVNVIRILCVNRSSGALATTATISCPSSLIQSIYGDIYVYGIIFQAASASVEAISIGNGSNSYNMTFEQCQFQLTSTGRMRIGSPLNDGIISSFKFIDCKFKFASTTSFISLYYSGVVDFAYNGTQLFDASGSTPANYLFSSYISGDVRFSGVDFSNFPNNIVVLATSGTQSIVRLRNCKLYSGNPLMYSTITKGFRSVFVEADNCDAGDTNYNMMRYYYGGSVLSETTYVRDGGACDGITNLSWKMASLLSKTSILYPLESPPILMWNDMVGSQITASVEILHSSASALTNADVWLEVEYLGTSGCPLGRVAANRVAKVTDSGTSYDTSAATWQGSLSNPKTHTLSVSFTPQEKGYIRAKVCLAKANYTIYVDPLITIS